MLTPDELIVAPDYIVALYQQLEDDIIADISRRLEKAGEITGSAEWQIYMLAEMGKDLDDIKDKIAEVNHKSKAEVERIFDEAIARSVGRDNLLFQKAGKGALDLAKNAGMQQFIAASAAKTAGDLKNLTKSLGFKDGKQFKPIARFYQDTLNYAQFQVASGAFSYQQAIKIAMAKMVESGIRVVDYESGVSTRVDVAVRRATLTGINQTAAQVTLMQMGELGGEYVEVTAHAGARPSHADWQGKVYHVGGDVKGYPDFEESTGYGTGEGLCGWNCRHNFHPFFPGISERNYTDKELENIDPPPFEYNGKTYTHYEATQKQRQIERAIRKTKQEIIAYDAAGLKEDFTWASVKLQRQKELYRDFSAKARLRTKDERHQLFGFGKSVSQKGVQAAKNVDKSHLKGYNKIRKGPIGLVDIQIDRFTNCLVERATGEEVNTTISFIVPKKKDFKGWFFDWTKPKKDGEKVYSLLVEGSDVVQGLVSMKFEYGGVYVGIVESAPHNKGSNGKYEGVGAHLFAIACKEAQDNGMDVVFFVAKTNLIPYYKNILGAEQIGSSQRMLIEGEAFENLIRTYFKKG